MKLDPKVYEAAKVVAESLKKELEERILGKKLVAWQCDCGCLGSGPAVAIEVVPAGREYPYQIGMWYIWSVKMAEPHLPPGQYSYSTGLSEFIPVEELREIFKNRFAGVGVLV